MRLKTKRMSAYRFTRSTRIQTPRASASHYTPTHSEKHNLPDTSLSIHSITQSQDIAIAGVNQSNNKRNTGEHFIYGVIVYRIFRNQERN